MTNIERAADLLFGRDDRRTLNIRFLCGGDPGVSAERLADQIIRAHTQISNNRARRVLTIDGHLTAA